ncbi:ferredoxin [Nocardia halotolerans]|uniref:Ferredoxin n=1 Tax=Nocardia halotolerans TaxID=1755878 RepID=A0ABV8VK11_9NOCA
MRITADRDRCVGAGMCALLAPTVFEQDDDEGRVVLLAAVPPGEHAAVGEAVQCCPSGALTIDEP